MVGKNTSEGTGLEVQIIVIPGDTGKGNRNTTGPTCKEPVHFQRSSYHVAQ